MSIASEITRLTNAKADIKAAIEAKGVSVPSSAKLDAFPSYVSQIEGGGGVDWDAIAQRTLSGVAQGSASVVSQYAFDNCGLLTGANFPNAVSIGTQAFYQCADLQSVSFPNVAYIGSSGFDGCSSLSEAIIPNASNLQYLAFGHCRQLKTVTLNGTARLSSQAFAYCASLSEVNTEGDGVLTLENSAFAYCYSLQIVRGTIASAAYGAFDHCSALRTVDLTACSYLANNVFQSCSNLSSVSLPIFSAYFSNNVFSGCYALQTVYAPLVSGVQSTAFYHCSSLSFLNLPNNQMVGSRAFYYATGLQTLRLGNSARSCYSVYQTAFQYCTELESVYLLWNNVPKAQLSTIFASTPIASSSYLGRFGSIFVPLSLLGTYRTATNWATYSSRFVGLTDEEIAALPI